MEGTIDMQTLPLIADGFAAVHLFDEETGRHTFKMLEGAFYRAADEVDEYEHPDLPGHILQRSEICRTEERALRLMVKIEMDQLQSAYNRLALTKHCMRGFLRQQGVENPNELMEALRPAPVQWKAAKQPDTRKPSGLVYNE